jgi:methyl-accepting chemotaxis protein
MNDQRIPVITLESIDQITAPKPEKDPLHLANVTIAAVDQIGEHAAKEIDEAAEALRKGAEEVANTLEELSAAIREHTIKASEQVAEFVKRSTHTLGIVRELQEKVFNVGGVNGREHKFDKTNGADNSETR